MSKILLYTDPHWSQYSSIVRKRGVKYSQRLENLIESINWAENLSKEHNCDMVICLGDFFDSPVLNSEELTALQDLMWNTSIPHFFLVGNHESGLSSLEFNSTKALERDGFIIVEKPKRVIIDSKSSLYFLPYIIEENRKNLRTYMMELTDGNPTVNNIFLSHNDILGIKYGKFESKEGFDIKEIEQTANLYLNGHLHNSTFLNNKETILNLGNLTGQNFGEDAYRYGHYAAILDTDTLNLSFYENPHAFNFYHVDIASESDLVKIKYLKSNSVVTFRCREDMLDSLRKVIPSAENIVEFKIVAYRGIMEVDNGQISQLSMGGMDYLEKFTDFILKTIGNSEVVREELSHISSGVR
jgi:DNA repair exonuclease SbcCD nuclease subunit